MISWYWLWAALVVGMIIGYWQGAREGFKIGVNRSLNDVKEMIRKGEL